MIKKINIYLILLWITLTSTFPFIFYTWPGHPYKKLTFFCLLLVCFLFQRSKKQIILPLNLMFIFIIQIIFFTLYSIISDEYSYYNLSIQIIVCFILILFIRNYIGFEYFAKSYILLIIIMGCGGVITFCLHLFIGINPIFQVQYSSTGTTYFLGLTSTNVYYNLDNLRVIRFSGFFDEPGAFSLYSLFATLINKIYFDNRKYEKMLIITTLFTFSIAYFSIILLYFILFYFKRQYIKYFLFATLIIFAFSLYLNNYSGDNKSLLYLNKFTFERFKMDADGNISGNNRKDASIADKKIFFDNLFWGVGDSTQIAGNNVFSVVARFGIIGSLFYYAIIIYFIILILKAPNTDKQIYIKVLFLILMNLFHRPEFSAAFIIISLYTITNKLEQLLKEKNDDFNNYAIV